jgi:hypothetical protein
MSTDKNHSTSGSQKGLTRIILAPPVARAGEADRDDERTFLAELGPGKVAMMGDNPDFEPMPPKPLLLDFFRHRLGHLTKRHLLQSAKRAQEAGHSEALVLACLLHDLAAGGLLRSDHGYWAAQMIAPYVSEEVVFAVRYHQALRYFADEAAGYDYPAAYRRYFGPDYVPPDYIRRDYEAARAHRYYMSARIVTINDIYTFDERAPEIVPDSFADIVGRNFREPEEGLGFDSTPVAHMWRTMIWPNNFL